MDPPLIVSYNFNIQENGIKSIGKDRYGVIYARTSNNVGDGAPLGSPVLAVGVTGQDGDHAYDLSGTAGMGVGNGKFAYTRDLDSIDGLLSFTLTGCFKTDVGETLGKNVELFKTKKLKLTSVNNGHLKLFVDSELELDSVTSSKADWNNVNSWTHFAVSYDGTRSVRNVKFYKATINSAVILSSTETLDRKSVNIGGAQRLYISNQFRPFDGYLDNMRIYGSKIDSSGALTTAQLEEQIRFDFLGVDGYGVGDPHFRGFDGTKFDFHGVHNHNYLIFCRDYNDTLVGKVRATPELQKGINKTCFSEFGLSVQGHARFRFSLQEVAGRKWKLKSEMNGNERRSDLNEKQVSLKWMSNQKKVMVETKDHIFTITSISLNSRFRRHLDFSVKIKKRPSFEDKYFGVLGMTLERKLSGRKFESTKSIDQNRFEFSMRKLYEVATLYPKLDLE